MAQYYFPHNADGEYVLEKPKHPVTGDAVSGGTGTMTWYRGSTPIAGQAWPETVTWDPATLSYRAPINAECETTLGERLTGRVAITDSAGRKYYDVLEGQVRTPSTPNAP